MTLSRRCLFVSPQKSIGLSIPELDVLQSSLYQLALAYYRGGEFDDALLVISALLPSAPLFHDPSAPRQHATDTDGVHLAVSVLVRAL